MMSPVTPYYFLISLYIYGRAHGMVALTILSQKAPQAGPRRASPHDQNIRLNPRHEIVC